MIELTARVAASPALEGAIVHVSPEARAILDDAAVVRRFVDALARLEGPASDEAAAALHRVLEDASAEPLRDAARRTLDSLPAPGEAPEERDR